MASPLPVTNATEQTRRLQRHGPPRRPDDLRGKRTAHPIPRRIRLSTLESARRQPENQPDRSDVTAQRPHDDNERILQSVVEQRRDPVGVETLVGVAVFNLSREQAREVIDGDPGVQAGVFVYGFTFAAAALGTPCLRDRHRRPVGPCDRQRQWLKLFKSFGRPRSVSDRRLDRLNRDRFGPASADLDSWLGVHPERASDTCEYVRGKAISGAAGNQRVGVLERQHREEDRHAGISCPGDAPRTHQSVGVRDEFVEAIGYWPISTDSSQISSRARNQPSTRPLLSPPQSTGSWRPRKVSRPA